MDFEEINKKKLFVIKVLSCFYFSCDKNGSSVFHNRPLNLAERHHEQGRWNLRGKCTPPPRFQQQQQQNIFQLHDFMYYCLPLRFSELPTTLTSKSELMGGKKVSYLNCCRDFSTCFSKQEGFWTFLIQSIGKYNTCSSPLTKCMMLLQNLNLIFDVALKRIRYKKNFAIFNKTNQRKFCEQFCKN